MINNKTKYHDAYDVINQALVKLKENFNESDDITYNFYIDKKQDYIYLSMYSPNEVDEIEDKIDNLSNEFFIKSETFKLLPVTTGQECFKINLKTDLVSEENGGYLLLKSKFPDLYIQQEYFLTYKLFNFDEIFSFIIENKVEVLVQEDYQFHCYINYDGKTGSLDSSLTPLSALVLGIKKYKENYGKSRN